LKHRADLADVEATAIVNDGPMIRAELRNFVFVEYVKLGECFHDRWSQTTVRAVFHLKCDPCAARESLTGKHPD